MLWQRSLCNVLKQHGVVLRMTIMPVPLIVIIILVSCAFLFRSQVRYVYVYINSIYTLTPFLWPHGHLTSINPHFQIFSNVHQIGKRKENSRPLLIRALCGLSVTQCHSVSLSAGHLGSVLKDWTLAKDEINVPIALSAFRDKTGVFFSSPSYITQSLRAEHTRSPSPACFRPSVVSI